MQQRTSEDAWIAPGEPPAFELVNETGRGRAIITCDHASAYIPKRLGTLGLAAEDRKRHIAWDIGAADIAHRLAQHLDAPLALTGYSRLVYDCNRPFAVWDACAERSEDTVVPGNVGIAAAEKEERAATFFWPYHDALHALVESRISAGSVPLMICVHTFTPVYRGFRRPWHVGVHYRFDNRAAMLALEALRREPDLTVGDNEPYNVTLDGDYTAPVHAERRGMPHVLFEIRQDLVATKAGAETWADRLAAVLTPILEHESTQKFGPRASDVREPRYENGAQA